MITATDPSMPNPTAYESAASSYGGAKDIYSTLGVEGSLGNINSYLNPYYDQVLNSAMGRLNTQKELDLGQLGDAAIRAGAFGGSRHGVAEGITRSEYGRQGADLEAGLRAQGFDRAAGLAQGDKFASAAGLANLGGQYFNVGNSLTQQQNQQGSQQQQLLQAILSGSNDAFTQYLQNPYQMIDLFQALLAGDARRGNSQTVGQSTPGLFDYLSLAGQTAAGVYGG